MDAGIKILLEIQDRDQRLASLRQQIEAAPREKEAVREELRSAEAASEAAKAQFFEVEKVIKDLQMDTGKARDRIRDLRAKATQVKKNEEYKMLMNEIFQQEGKIKNLEDKELGQMEGLEAAKSGRREVDARLKAAQDRVNEAQQDIDLREAACRDRLQKIEAERAELAAQAPVELFRLYDRLIARFRKIGKFRKVVAPIENDACGSCYLKVTAYVRQKAMRRELTTCENCGAILYLDN